MPPQLDLLLEPVQLEDGQHLDLVLRGVLLLFCQQVELEFDVVLDQGCKRSDGNHLGLYAFQQLHSLVQLHDSDLRQVGALGQSALHQLHVVVVLQNDQQYGSFIVGQIELEFLLDEQLCHLIADPHAVVVHDGEGALYASVHLPSSIGYQRRHRLELIGLPPIPSHTQLSMLIRPDRPHTLIHIHNRCVLVAHCQRSDHRHFQVSQQTELVVLHVVLVKAPVFGVEDDCAASNLHQLDVSDTVLIEVNLSLIVVNLL